MRNPLCSTQQNLCPRQTHLGGHPIGLRLVPASLFSEGWAYWTGGIPSRRVHSSTGGFGLGWAAEVECRRRPCEGHRGMRRW